MALIGLVTAATLLSCPNPEMVNESKYDWDKHDQEVLAQAKETCKLQYDNSCVLLFIKVDTNDYKVLCGGVK